jgi:hypothetical protein
MFRINARKLFAVNAFLVLTTPLLCHDWCQFMLG